jgi:tripartite-type tricarboxylate transporter receptor subunit TctC
MPVKHEFLHVLLLSIATALPTPGQAALSESGYPSKPIRFVVPFPPGGTPDFQGRMLAEPLRALLGQPVVIDNRPGVNGAIGMEIVARARPDGHTLIIATVGNWAVHPHLYKLPYDVLKDFAPIIHVATTPGVVVVGPSIPVKTVKDLIVLAKQKPGELTYGSAGVGGFSHVSVEMFCVMTQTKMTHVPYKSSVTALIDMIGGSIQVMFNSAVQTIPHIRTGKVRALATTGAKRAAALPELPTVAEAGVPGYENSTWSAIAGPAGIPPAIIHRLNREFSAILRMPDIQEKHAGSASTVTGGTPEQLRDYVRAEVARYGKLVKEAGIKGESGG